MPTQLTGEMFKKLRPLITWSEYGSDRSSWPFRLYYVRDCWRMTPPNGLVPGEHFTLVLETPSNLLAPKKFQAKRGWMNKSPWHVMEVRRILIGQPIITAGPVFTDRQVCIMREPEAWYPCIQLPHNRREHEEYATAIGSDAYLSWPPSDDSIPIHKCSFTNIDIGIK